jgi:hypothetical protein
MAFLRRLPNRSSLVDPGLGGPPRRRFLHAAAIVAFATSAAIVLPEGARCDPVRRAGSTKVVLVRMGTCCAAAACSDIEDLIADELGSTALDFNVIDGGAGDAKGGWTLLAAQLGGDCGVAFRVRKSEGGAACKMELWAQGGGPDETVHRTSQLPALDEPDADVNSAIASAEAVFAVLLEMRLVSEEALRRPPATPAPGEESAAPANAPLAAPVPAAAAETRVEPERAPALPAAKAGDKLLGLGVGACLVWSPGGVSPMGGVRLGFDVRPLSWLTLRADSWITVVGRDLEEVDATATFNAAALRLAAFYEFVRSGVVRPALGVAGGGFVVWTSGSGSGAYEGGWGAGLAGYAGGEGRVAFLIGDWFRAELGAAVGAVLPEVRVRFDGESVATFGRPAIDAFAQIELSFL